MLAARAAAVRHRRRQRLERSARAPTCSASPRRTRCRSAARSASRTCSTTGIANYVGDVGIGINPKLAERIKEADLLLAIGPRLGEMTTGGYTLLAPPRPAQKLVARPRRRRGARPRLPGRPADQRRHAAVRGRAGGDDAGRRVRVACRDAGGERRLPRVDDAARQPRAASRCGRSSTSSDERLPEDAIVTNGAGNFTGWVHRFYQYGRFRTQLGADLRRDGLRRARRRRGEDRCTPSAW